MTEAGMTGALPRLPPGFRLLRYDRLGSSNDEAKRLAREGAAPWTTVWAVAQSGGRGRRGRSWVSSPGNLFVSFVVRAERPPAVAAQLGFVAALAVGEAVGAHVPSRAAISCKWPNDVLLDGGKIAGILLESETSAGGGLDWLVIGVGVNIVDHPADAAYKATSLRAAGAGEVDAASLLESLAARLHIWFGRWLNEGFASVRQTWLDRATGLDEAVTVRLEGDTLAGRFAGLDEDGALLLETASGTRRITAGDVFPARG
jgi:BirA family biotin operon repressor/biotin-[acetyl-CoA-carboxylase] ligase